MGLSKDEWFRKLSGLVPGWVTRETVESRAIFRGMAAVLAQTQADSDEHYEQTFISEADEEFVQFHADERSIERLDGENLSSFRDRIKRFINQSNLPALKRLVDAQLVSGESRFIEHDESLGLFLNRDAYINRDLITFNVLYNAFTIIIDAQIPDPQLFADRGGFVNREFLSGSHISLDSVFENVIRVVNENIADGTVYRLIERSS